MNLIIDLGNSLAKFYVFENDSVVKVFVVNYFDFFLAENSDVNFPNSINKPYLNKIFPETIQFENIIISSVIEFQNDFIEYLEHKVKNKNITQLTSKTKIPIKNLYESKETLGKDRIAAVVGANVLFPNTNILIIDAGSAITYEFISSDNEYLGGNISAGLQMRLKALNTFTKKLPLIDINEASVFFDMRNDGIGKNTNSAIINGVFLSLMAEIGYYIENFKHKYKTIKIILTGGDSIFFEKKIKNKIFVEPNLVAIGLNRILNYNLKCSSTH